MGKIIETKIDRFDAGIVNDTRDRRSGVAQMITNFDILTNPRRITPYRDSEDATPSLSLDDVDQVQNFQIALRTGTTYSFYGLGFIVGTSTARVVYKNITTSSTDDLSDDGWIQAANGTQNSSTGSTDLDLFIYYRKTGLIYGARNGSHIWAFSPTGSAWDNTQRA